MFLISMSPLAYSGPSTTRETVFSAGGVSRTPSSRSKRRAPLGQRSTTSVTLFGSEFSGWIQGRFPGLKTSGKPVTHSLAWMQRTGSKDTETPSAG